MSKVIGIAIVVIAILIGGKIYYDTPTAQVDSLSRKVVSFEFRDGRKVYLGSKEFKKLKAGTYESEFVASK